MAAGQRDAAGGRSIAIPIAMAMAMENRSVDRVIDDTKRGKIRKRF
jgi:hypothetical protein